MLRATHRQGACLASWTRDQAEEVPAVSLAEIVERLDQISQVWRSDTSAEQRLDRQPPPWAAPTGR